LAKQEGNEKKNKNKKESRIVNKESFCATIALFSILVLLILCTRTLIFGGFGFVIHSFLTGAFGYFAYPLVLGVFYVSAFGLFGKRKVKNRKLFFFCVLLICSAALIAHTALTYSWFDKKQYLQACFNAGATFPKTTVCGLVGGALVYGVASLTTKVGALIVYSIITVFLMYVCITVAGKQAQQPKPSVDQAGATTENAEIPLYQPTATQTQAPIQQSAQRQVVENAYQQQGMPSECVPMPGYQPTADAQNYAQSNAREELAEGYTPTVAQRPGVSLQEGENTSFGGSRAFSPFGMPNGQDQTNDAPAYDYANSREFLFGGTPAENYRRNLIFDPNARVNNRPNVPTNHPTINDGYTPSYTDAYQNSVNDSLQPRPVKIVNDQSQSDYSYNSPFGGNAPQEATPPPVVQTNFSDERPFSQNFDSYTPNAVETEDRDAYRLSEPTERSSYLNDERAENETPFDNTYREDFSRGEERGRGEELDRGRDDGYRRHDYMDLFSTDNPNVFGGEEETLLDRAINDGRVAREISERTFDRGDSLTEDTRNSRADAYDEEPRSRNGLNLFDEEEDTYTLRSDYEVSRGDSETLNDRSVGFERDMEMRGRGYDEVLDDTRGARTPIAPMAQNVEITPPEPEPAIMPKITEVAPTPPPPKPRVIRPYVRVPLDDFDCRDVQPTANDEEVEETKQNILATLSEFRVNGAEIASVTFGPTVTRYNVAIPRSISPKKVVALDQSIAISLHSSGVNVYPNYEDGVVSIEAPNKERQFVQLGCMLSGDTFVNAKPSSLMFAMGKDVANRKVYGDINKMIHLLVAGSSGSGKSVFLGALITSLIYKYSPEELRLILIDPKMTEFVIYNGLPHLMINEIITDANKAVQSLNWAIGEMNRRYQLFEQMSRSGTYVQNLDQYNGYLDKSERLPKIVIIIDELADLMLAAKKEMEDRIQNLTQKARAAGIHLIVATQRPSTDVITGVIKSNLPTRVAFYVATDVDSRVILDQTGAQKLLGKGDMLYTMPGLAAPIRVQSAFISPEESQRVVNFIKNNNEAYYDEEATAFINSRGGNAGEPSDPLVGNKNSAIDPTYIEALRYVISIGSASISMVQRRCGTGYSRAGKIIEWMEDMGYISPFDGAKARKVLISKEEFESKYGPL